MIESIRVKGPASFKDTEAVLDGLSEFNYMYGSNGSGKTTISRVLADSANYADCHLAWKGGTIMEPLVYNKDFVERNFAHSAEVKGIFTLGEASQAIVDKIAECKAELDKINNAITGLNITLQGSDGNGGKRSELSAEVADFEEKCWRIKDKHDPKFQAAFSGARGSKRAFKERVLTEANANAGTTQTIQELEARASTVFGQSPQTEASITLPNFDGLLKAEALPELGRTIIGKKDVDIAALIEKLQNSDWVKAGMRYAEGSDGQCPFCQQSLPEGIGNSLREYFDESFERDTAAVKQLQEDYRADEVRISQTLEGIIGAPSRSLDATSLKAQVDLLKGIIARNGLLIEKKVNEPSLVVALEPHTEVVGSIKSLLDAANSAIAKHNGMVNNLPEEKKALTSDVWRHLLDVELKSDLASHQTKKSGIDTAIAALEKRLVDGAAAKQKKEQEIQGLEKQTTSIEPTVKAINQILTSFGFEGFKLAKADTAMHYRLVRSDGSDAKDTLSEGERTFVTFLYFYHLLKGSLSESGVNTDRIAVFDDPVSSLDSDVLFIVSNLIKGLFDEVRTGSGRLKQVFILTHNVYFHKEVAYHPNRKGEAMNEETFWIVRKVNGVSKVEKHGSNPIKTSYELLWAEVRKPSGANVYIQNTLRRIIENYFKILGSIDPDTICNKFDGAEKLICRSLLSWVNDGSHYAHDDLHVSIDDSQVTRYLTVFKQVFVRSGHEAHYTMMMGLEKTPELTDSTQAVATA